MHGDTYWTPPQVEYSSRLKKYPGFGAIAMRQVMGPKSAPSERLPEEKKVLDDRNTNRADG